MNLNTLTPEEIIRYIDNGVITEDIPSAVFIKVVKYMQDQITGLEEELKSEDVGFDNGWEAAVNEMMNKLENM